MTATAATAATTATPVRMEVRADKDHEPPPRTPVRVKYEWRWVLPRSRASVECIADRALCESACMALVTMRGKPAAGRCACCRCACRGVFRAS